ncbi:eukaryotic translation initiation factor 4G-like isoform X2 [Rutidosis leptorrhynchoides]|uniref:eukaryotic translation initiation factor 4G-like isoform X2 n=1 Tax=Rutidosis leptorrhynchoides TaxID=125765 RepID=UPI003A9A0304
MSVNQSRGDKNEPSQYRRSGRSGNPNSPRNYSGGGGGGGKGGGGTSTTAPPSSAYSGKSFKKVVSNAQGAQGRGTGPNPNVNSYPNPSTGGRAPQNGAQVQASLGGTPDASLTGAPVKSANTSVQKSTPGLPKAPQSNVVPPSSGANAPATPIKGSGDASRAFPLQFGSISPGVMNGMQVPARTNSAPPNMDEQKRAQARLESIKATTIQNPSTVPKQQVPRKDVGPVDKPNVNEPRPTSKDKKEVPPSAPHVTPLSQKPTGPPMPSIPPVSMQMPFHQSPIHIPFGGPNPQLQSQPMPNTSLPVPHPMHISVGNPPQVPPQVFVQHHHHHQGMIHQTQGLPFGNMNMGIGLGPQYQQQQQMQQGPMGNMSFGSTRRAVKITHPETHEELQLGKRADGYLNGATSGPPRPHLHGPPQSQAVPSFPSGHPYFHNSYNASPLFIPPPGAAQNAPGSQPPRFYNQASKQVTVKPAISSHPEKAVVDKTEISNNQKAGVEVDISGQTRKETIAGSSLPQPEKSNDTSSSPPAPIKDSTTSVNRASEAANELAVNKSGSFKEEEKQSIEKIQSIPEDKVDAQSSVVQESSTPLTVSMESNKLTSSDESASKFDTTEKGLDSAKVIGSETQSENSPKTEDPVAEKQVKEHVSDQIPDIPVSDATVVQQNEPTNDIDDKSSESVTNTVHGDQVSDLNDRLSNLDVEQVSGQQPVSLNEDSPSVSVSVPEIPPLTTEPETTGLISPSSSKIKGNNNNSTSKGKMKRRDVLKNADARGTASDLYNAYKRPEEKKETSSSENAPVESSEREVSSFVEKRGPAKFEPDDWEDAADISGPKMETGLKLKNSEEDNDGMTKKYSRDFLLKFSDHCTDLPEGFEITNDISEAFGGSGVNSGRDSYPSPGRSGGDRAVNSGARLDRRPSNIGLEDKWKQGPGPMIQPGWDPRVDMQAYLGRATHGVLRTPRGQPPGQYMGGISPGQMLMQSPGPHMQRNNADSDRWARATGYQKSPMPSPHNTPAMHKAERKYEVGKVTDEEQAKQRQLKGILNKLTPQNFEKLFEQVKQVNIDNSNTLSGVIGQIFDKALMEPTFVEMYANFCARLSMELPDFTGENKEKVTFKRLLLNKCQEEFERGVREEEEANRTEEEGEVKQTDEEREEKRVKARRRMLGNIRLIGELYKKKMLTERIMHECIKKLLGQGQGQHQNPDEEDIEALCKLMSTIGEMIDHPRAKEHMDYYFDMMLKLSNNMDLSSRLRFMLKDAIDLRKNKWQQRRKVEGPKKIEEVHRDAANERQAQSSRLSRGPSFNPGSTRRGGPMEFGPRNPSNALPLNPQMSGYRGPPQQLRSFGGQDLRFEPTTLPVPLRPMGDDNITFGPQGGLARGMSVRGQPSSIIGGPGPNGYGSVHERVGYTPREDLAARYMSERGISPRPGYDLSNMQEHNMSYGNRDMWNSGRGFDQPSPMERTRVSTPPQSGPTDNKVLSEDRLRDLSEAAIKEYYSARDEKEVAMCMKDLNAPGFYPSMISIWVNNSFERKAEERNSLTKLLINLAKSHDQILSRDSLVKGFEMVLSTLEDVVYDAPLAAEFLGHIFAKILLENVISYTEVWRMIYEGGEEKGQLVESGHAADVLGVILETIKSEKGDPFLNNLVTGSNPRLENFRPATINKKLRLDKFI